MNETEDVSVFCTTSPSPTNRVRYDGLFIVYILKIMLTIIYIFN